jgi:WD40 repeat protein
MKALLYLLVGLICPALLVRANSTLIDGAGTGSGARRGPSDVLDFGPEEFVQASGADIVVPGYSVPSFVRWDGDDLRDLIVGEGGDEYPGKVRVYLNVGTSSDPEFGGHFYVQSLGDDLTVPAQGCLGAFPRVVYWDGDDRKDLLIGRADGTVELFLNNGLDDAPTFGSGRLLQVGEVGAKVDIDVFYRATPTVADWDNDGKKDLIVGSVDGLIYLYLNEGTDVAPDFRSQQYAEMDGGELLSVPTTRSSPVVHDLDGDGKKDLLTGDREGQLLFYANSASDEAPAFAPYSLARSDGVPIDLPDLPRSRPFVCDWSSDGLLDVLVGCADGKVRLYQGVAPPGNLDLDGDVDLFDLDVFVDCLAGPDETTPPGGCTPEQFGLADLDADDDVDLADFTGFQIAFTGS